MIFDAIILLVVMLMMSQQVAGEFTYVGCYRNVDGPARQSHHLGDKSWDTCRKLALDGGKTIFGMEWPQGYSKKGNAQCLLLDSASQYEAMAKGGDSECEKEGLFNGKRLGDSYRVAIYAQTIDEFKIQTDDGDHYTGLKGLTPMQMEYASMSEEELDALQLHSPIAMSDADVPKALNLYESGYLPPVKNQGSCGSCWAFATTDAMAGRYAKKNKKRIDLSENHVLDCTYEGWTRNGLRVDGCLGGWLTHPYDNLGRKGFAGQSNYPPYDNRDDVCPSDHEFENKHFKRVAHSPASGKIHQYYHDKQGLKKELVKYGPCAISVYVPDWFGRGAKKDDYVYNCPKKNPTHAMTVVGFGTTSQGKDYWLVKNSWGSGWGLNGFVKLSMETCGFEKQGIQVLCPEVRRVDTGCDCDLCDWNGKCIVACPGDQFRDEYGNCRACKKTCPEGQFIGETCTATEDAQCKACTPCPDGQYIKDGCEGEQDSICEDIPADAIFLRPADERKQEFDANARNLEECTGQCNSDVECKGHLKCFRRTGFTRVPGCFGKGSKDWNYCYDARGSITLSGDDLDEKSWGLRACTGECDSDDQCAFGLKCFHTEDSDTIPGCTGTGLAKWADYCYDPDWTAGNYRLLGGWGRIAEDEGRYDAGFAGKISVEECKRACDEEKTCKSFKHCPELDNRCWLSSKRFKGNEPTINSVDKYFYICETHYRHNYNAIPELSGTNNGNEKNLRAPWGLDMCQGDCDRDSDCKPGLKCFHRSGFTPVPGCIGKGNKDRDYCYDPTGSIPLVGKNDDGARGLLACTGECDKDSDCASGLKCFHREKGENIPGCYGNGLGNWADYCYDPMWLPGLPNDDVRVEKTLVFAMEGCKKTYDLGKKKTDELFFSGSYTRQGIRYDVGTYGDVEPTPYVYYKRLTPPNKSVSIYDLMLENWRLGANLRNQHNKDFALYSTLEDAVKDKNRWKFCNANDPGIGFPRDCGPERATWHRWIRGVSRHEKCNPFVPTFKLWIIRGVSSSSFVKALPTLEPTEEPTPQVTYCDTITCPSGMEWKSGINPHTTHCEGDCEQNCCQPEADDASPSNVGFETYNCNGKAQGDKYRDLQNSFSIAFEVTTARSWQGPQFGSVFGVRGSQNGVDAMLDLRAQATQTGRLYYNLFMVDMAPNKIVDHKFGMELGRQYQMVVAWCKETKEVTWTVDGVEVVRVSAPQGFGRQHKQRRFCWGLGGGAKGWTGTVHEYTYPVENDWVVIDQLPQKGNELKVINLKEVVAYDTRGRVVTPVDAAWNVGYPEREDGYAMNCITDPQGDYCHSDTVDKDPRLRIRYAPGAKIASVRVVNRACNQNCLNRINGATIRVFSEGEMQWSDKFDGAKQTYIFEDPNAPPIAPNQLPTQRPTEPWRRLTILERLEERLGWFTAEEDAE